jgi:cytochrome P450
VATLRAAVQRIIDERRQGTSKRNFEECADLLDILLTSPLYQNDEEKMKDELIVLFFAGMDTIKTSIVNTICFLVQNPTFKAKFMAEIIPILDAASDDFVVKLNTEATDEFEYVRRCWFESMRLQPPATNSSFSYLAKDVRIKGVDFNKDTMFMINIAAIHMDPKEWTEPETYCPDRFDPKSSMWKRPDGKPRNPFSFCPFNGGSRICLGKTLAETMAVNTLPLMMYHFDFDFLDPAHRLHKPDFTLGSPKEPVIPMKCTRIRSLKKHPEGL